MLLSYWDGDLIYKWELYGGSEGQHTTNAHTPFLRTNHNAVFCQMLWFDPEGLEHKIKKNDIQ